MRPSVPLACRAPTNPPSRWRWARGSVACTENVCDPSASPVYCWGDVQLDEVGLSRRQPNVTPGSSE